MIQSHERLQYGVFLNKRSEFSLWPVVNDAYLNKLNTIVWFIRCILVIINSRYSELLTQASLLY